MVEAVSTLPTPAGAHRVVDLALRTGELLLAGGASAAEVTATCGAVARAGGLRRVECDITFTSITVTGQAADVDGAPVSGLRLVQSRELDYSKVSAVHAVVSDLVEGRITPSEADHRLTRIVAARHRYQRLTVTAARATLAAAVALLLGAGPVVTAAAFGATVLVDLTIVALGRQGLPAFFLNAAGGLVATAVALVLVAVDVGVRPSLVVAGGIVLLLPGVTLVGAVHDAITGFYVTASARAFETFLLTAGILSGIAIALSLGGRLGVPVTIWDPPTTGLGDIPLQLLAAAAASTSFAVSNYAPLRTLPVAGGSGALGWAVVVGLDRLELSATLASATAAIVIGAGSYVVALYQRVPAMVYVAAGIIPLLPGLTIYRALRRLSSGDTAGGIALLGTAITIGLALAAGALFGEYLAQALRRTKNPLERRLSGLMQARAARRGDRPLRVAAEAAPGSPGRRRRGLV
ncbi:UNVERIFIED_ORG: threonine/serine exporter family protein [Bacillus sp. AZ43]